MDKKSVEVLLKRAKMSSFGFGHTWAGGVIGTIGLMYSAYHPKGIECIAIAGALVCVLVIVDRRIDALVDLLDRNGTLHHGPQTGPEGRAENAVKG